VTHKERERMKRLEVTLDQCWDLLHQRRAGPRRGQGPRPADCGGVRRLIWPG
jgi:hypothetical protein